MLQYCLLGIGAGVIAGLLGVGGGIIVVPAAYFLFRWQGFAEESLMHMAIGTSLANIVFTAISSSYAHHKKSAVDWALIQQLLPGIIIGAILGASLAAQIKSDQLRIAFGVFEILVALQIWFKLTPSGQVRFPGQPWSTLMGLLIGSVSTLLGIGGGTLVVPLLLWCSIDIRKAVGTSSACGFPIALTGALAFLWLGWEVPGLPEHSLGYIYLPAVLGITFSSMIFAPLGARIAHSIPQDQLKKLFALTIFLVGIKILT